MKQQAEKQDIVCTQYSYTGIPYLHSDNAGNLYVQKHEHNGRSYSARRLTVTLNGNSRRIKLKGKVIYFSELKARAFKEKNTIDLRRVDVDDMPF